MKTSLKAGFAQIFSCCPKNLSCPKFGGAAAPLAPPARTPMPKLNSFCNTICACMVMQIQLVVVVFRLVSNCKKLIQVLEQCNVLNFIGPIHFHLILQILAKFSQVESERTVFKCRKRKRQLLCCVHLESEHVKLGRFMSRAATTAKK